MPEPNTTVRPTRSLPAGGQSRSLAQTRTGASDLTRSRRVCPLRKKLRGFERRKCGRVPGEGNPSLGETRLRATLPEVTNTLLRPSACAREGEPTDAVEGPPIDQDAPGPSTGQAQGDRGRSVTRGREVHVVLRRAGPGAAPVPADRAECAYDRRCDHPAAKPRAIHVARALPVACLPTPDVRVLQRVQVDRPTIRVVRPAPRTGASRAGRRHGLATFERPAHVTVGRARAPPTHTSRRDACGGSGTAGRRASGRHRGDRRRTRGPRRAGRNAPRRRTPSGRP